MNTFELDPHTGVLRMRLGGDLGGINARSLSDRLDVQVARHGDIRALMIQADRFPDHKAFSELIRQIRPLREAVPNITRVAVITASPAVEYGSALAGALPQADIQGFSSAAHTRAETWVADAAGQAPQTNPADAESSAADDGALTLDELTADAESADAALVPDDSPDAAFPADDAISLEDPDDASGADIDDWFV